MKANTYLTSFQNNMVSAVIRNETNSITIKPATDRDSAQHWLNVNSLIVCDGLIAGYKSLAYSRFLIRQSKLRVSKLIEERRAEKVGFKKSDSFELERGKTAHETKYTRVFRKYLRKVNGADYEIRSPTVIQSWEDWEPSDWNGDINAVTPNERTEQRKHVLAHAKYARRDLIKTTLATFEAKQSKLVSDWLENHPNRDEIIDLLESPLYLPDPNQVSNIADPIWQSVENTLPDYESSGLCPKIKITNWDSFKTSMQYASWYKGRHWSRIGQTRDGSDTWIIRPNLFNEHVRRAKLNRVISPEIVKTYHAEIANVIDDWSEKGMKHLIRKAGLILTFNTAPPLGRKPSLRVERARERARAKAAARRAAAKQS